MNRTLWGFMLPCRNEADNPKAAQQAADATAPETDAAAREKAVTDAGGTDCEKAAGLRETLLRAVEERTGRAEKGVLRSIAEQNGMDEQALAAILEQARQERSAELPPEVQAKLDEANARVTERLLAAEVKSIGTEMGLLDTEAALKLLDPAGIAVSETGEVSGVREALETLKQRKGYLFAQASRGAWAQRVGTGSLTEASGVEEAFYRKNPLLRKENPR